uniref:Amphiphysin n=1 Tax=Oryzias melastigma TaxID=30732 RepID=A0A3B3D0W7_ORYME
MKAYMSAIKGMQQASINLTQSLHEVYEPDWHGKDEVLTIGKDCDALWEDFHNKLVDSTLLNLDEYLLQFPDLKTRVAKRSRKLIDYDSARHHLETLQTSGLKNDRKITKAEEELRKAQRVFDELNVGLQDELPTLWDRRVGFYISTFKSVTSLEAKFHREISLVCRELYEVMTQLREQHSDKIFTIQGAPSDSGPLRLARTPSPPEDESPPESPDMSYNNRLRPVSPGPPRPKSPVQLKKGPPVPPPPKVTPTKELAEEQIIDLFGGDFLPAPSPSQPNERPGESLLDLDFDAFQPDESVSPIPQTAVPWDMWSGNSQPAQPVADTGFVAEWTADFGSMSANGEAASSADAFTTGLQEGQGGAQEGTLVGDGDTKTSPQDKELVDEVSWQESQTNPHHHSRGTSTDEDDAGQADAGSKKTTQEDRRKSTPGLIFTNEFGEEVEDSTGDRGDNWSRSVDGSGSEYETAEEWGDSGQGGGWASADEEFPIEDHPLVDKSDNLEGDVEDGVVYEQTEAESDSSQMTCSEKQMDSSAVNDHFGASSKEDQRDLPPKTDHLGLFGLDSESSAEIPTAAAFDLDPFGEKETEGMFDLNLPTEKKKDGGFESDPFAEKQGQSGCDLSLFAEKKGGGGFDSDPFAEKKGGGGFDSDPFAEKEGGAGFDSDPFAEKEGGGGFESDLFAEKEGGGGFESDPFAEKEGGGGFDSDLFTEKEGGGGFDSDPFAEKEGGGGFDSDPFAEKEGEGGFDSDPFAEKEGGEIFSVDAFAPGSTLNSDVFQQIGLDHSQEEQCGQGKDILAGCNMAGSLESSTSGPQTSAVRQASMSRGHESLPAPQTSFHGTPAEGKKEAKTPVTHKDTENSDMSEDEATNRRLGKLYQDLDTEKEEVASSFNGFTQDAGDPSFFADFDNIASFGAADSEQVEPFTVPPAEETKTTSDEAATSEQMPIPSVVIEPASSNEGDDDRDADIISPTTISDNGVAIPTQPIKHMSPSGSASGLPDDFLYKVETMHDFEAANSDELDLKRGDIVLVIPTASVEDQDAGWLTGFKENDWLTLGVGAQKGLFPENFTQRLE